MNKPKFAVLAFIAILITNCCPSTSPFDLNEVDITVLHRISAFEHFQMRMTDLAVRSEGSASFIVKDRDWDHLAILQEVQAISTNNDLYLPGSETESQNHIIVALQACGDEKFNQQYLAFSQREFETLIADLRDEERFGADLIVKSLAAKLLKPVLLQKDAIDSVLSN